MIEHLCVVDRTRAGLVLYDIDRIIRHNRTVAISNADTFQSPCGQAVHMILGQQYRMGAARLLGPIYRCDPPHASVDDFLGLCRGMEHIEWLRIKTNIPCQLISDERVDDLATAHIWVGDVRNRGPILGSLAVTASMPGAKFRGAGAGRQQRRQPRCEGLWPNFLHVALALGRRRRHRADYHKQTVDTLRKAEQEVHDGLST